MLRHRKNTESSTGKKNVNVDWGLQEPTKSITNYQYMLTDYFYFCKCQGVCYYFKKICH